MVSPNLTLHYDRMMLILEPTLQARALARKQVEVVNYPDGRFAVRHAGCDLAFKMLDKIAVVTPGAIVESKAAWRGAGLGKGPAGGLPGLPTARCSWTGKATEQPGSTWHRTISATVHGAAP